MQGIIIYKGGCGDIWPERPYDRPKQRKSWYYSEDG